MDTKIKLLKNKIISRDWVLQGTLLRQYKQCGKTNCRCHQDKKYWHGPYWIWTRKEKGKTITKTLSQKQAGRVKKALEDMKKLNTLVEKWKLISLRHIEKI